MKKLATILCLVALASGAYAQGLVKFLNSGSTLISYGNEGEPAIGAAQPLGTATYYYALLIAPLGTSDPLAFTFAGIYATNTATTTGGRLLGGSANGVAVAGWAAGESRSFEIAGWSASLGNTWNTAWLANRPNTPGNYFGLSGIGAGFAGGTDSNGASIPPLALFGAAPSLTSGFVMTTQVPEPTVMALAGLSAAALMIFRRRK